MKKRVLHNIMSGLLSQATAVIYGFIVPILLISCYGSKVNGLTSSIAQFIAYINLLQLGIGPVIKSTLYGPVEKKDTRKIGDILGAANSFFRKIAYVLILYIIVLCVVFPLINREFPVDFSVSLIIIISFGTFFEYFLGMTYKIYLTSVQKDYVVDYINIIGYIISLIMIYILVKTNQSIQSVKLIGSLVFLIKPLLMKYYFDKKIQIKINKDSKYVFKDKLNGFAHHIASTIQNNTDVVVLTIFSTLTNVSIYAVYHLVVNSINNIIVSLTNGIDGYFGRILAKNDNSVNKKFNTYSFFFYTIATILLGCSLVLVTPFVSVYTSKIVDANYVQWTFGYLMVFAEFNFAIRYPYSTLVYSKGHFKETTKFAIIEPIVNIIISIIFVTKYGLIGVAIGTLISMPIRSFGFITHAIKNILNDRYWCHFKIILLSYLEMIIIFLLRDKLIIIDIHNYFNWIIEGLFVFLTISTFVIITNMLIIKSKLRRNNNEK